MLLLVRDFVDEGPGDGREAAERTGSIARRHRRLGRSLQLVVAFVFVALDGARQGRHRGGRRCGGKEGRVRRGASVCDAVKRE